MFINNNAEQFFTDQFNLDQEENDEKSITVSIDHFRRILAAVHQEGNYVNTLYSNIYDLKKKLVYLYHFHNFENKLIIDLKEELKKGKHSYDLPSLFPKNYAADTFLQIYQKRKEFKQAKVNPQDL